MLRTSLLITLSIFAAAFSNPSFALFNEKAALLEDEKNTIEIYKEYVKSVVNVSNIQIARMGWFDLNELEIPAGSGSGFVWDDKGHIVTNFHVVAGGDSFVVTFHKDKKQYKAKLVGAEPQKDIAVLKVIDGPSKLHPINIGTSKSLQVGQKALAIGNPFGLDHSVSTGTISALGRKIPGIGNVSIHGMIQTDASINPGNSGGPLLNSQGKLIGMNTMIFSKSGTSSGVGFAVPVDTINRVVPQIIKYGQVARPKIGVHILEDQYKEFFGVEEGIIVKSVIEGGPADKAGIKGMKRDRRGRYILGDVIVSIDGKKLNSFDDIYHALDLHKVGDSVDVIIQRDGKKKNMKLKLQDVKF